MYADEPKISCDSLNREQQRGEQWEEKDEGKTGRGWGYSRECNVAHNANRSGLWQRQHHQQQQQQQLQQRPLNAAKAMRKNIKRPLSGAAHENKTKTAEENGKENTEIERERESE